MVYLKLTLTNQPTQNDYCLENFLGTGQIMQSRVITQLNNDLPETNTKQPTIQPRMFTVWKHSGN